MNVNGFYTAGHAIMIIIITIYCKSTSLNPLHLTNLFNNMLNVCIQS